MRIVESGFVMLIGLFLMTRVSFAEEQPVRSGFWGEIDLGIGLLQQSFDEIEVDDAPLFLGFKAGYMISPQFSMGLELSGCLLEAGDLEDPGVGEGISQVFLIARYYPYQKSNLFVNGGGGYASIWNNRPGQWRRKNGWGLTMGGGYDFRVNSRVALGPFVNFGNGSAEELNYKVIHFGIGMTFQ